MKKFDCITVDYIPEQQLLSWKIKDMGMPNFCLSGLEEFVEFGHWIRSFFSNQKRPLRYVVSGSELDGIYNMGGDLAFFLDCIKNRKLDELQNYAHLCVDAIYNIHDGFGLPVVTVAIVEGNAYGGGFECALAHDFILAQENAKFALPENKFNMFPGMGAHSLLTRKLNPADADELMRSNKTYTSRFLQSLGLIEKVFEVNQARNALHQFTDNVCERFNFEYHHLKCKKMLNPISKEELLAITDIWVEASMRIGAFDLRKMEILSKAQNRRQKKINIMS